MPKIKSKNTVPIVSDSKVTNVRGQQNKKATKRIKNSNFVLLINPNRKIGPYEEELEPFCQTLKDSVEEIIQNIGDYLLIEEDGHEFTPEWFKKVEAISRVERGEEQDRVHCHALVCVSHYSKIKLDLGKIRERIIEDCNVSNPFIRVRVMRSVFGKHVLDATKSKWRSTTVIGQC